MNLQGGTFTSLGNSSIATNGGTLIVTAGGASLEPPSINPGNGPMKIIGKNTYVGGVYKGIDITFTTAPVTSTSALQWGSPPDANYNVTMNFTHGGSAWTGTFSASPTKTFTIQHPLEEDKYLVHACLEGPEAGVYYRGTAQLPEGQPFVEVVLPNYTQDWYDWTIQVTQVVCPIKEIYSSYGVTDISNGKFKIYGRFVVGYGKHTSEECRNCCHKFHWIAHAKRQSINVEPNKTETKVHAYGPYTWHEPVDGEVSSDVALGREVAVEDAQALEIKELREKISATRR